MPHLRRAASPAWWPIARKEGGVWTVRPVTGPHKLHRSMPLAIFVRDLLRYAKTLREARYIISRGYIKVDGRVRREYKFPVGVMDIVEIVPTGEVYRIVPDPVKYIRPVAISSGEADLKLLRVEGKNYVSGNRIQLHFHDGRNLILSPDEGLRYKTFDSVVYSLSERRIKQHVPFKLGVNALIFDGGNTGFFGQLVEINWTLKRKLSTVALKSGDEVRRTIIDYVMPVGEASIKIS
ncbi:30S ribosomal protein S4e [Thermoproteus tenax]|uniref:Small ribosomal subunit protein eS4 n=1 Tax=Thermoproteus tenax (strain ATCC 35583 / DSM 2078 / JCM 9277 / NBRC 100435 / Kra 1) TaxID=768679 RepID=G4RMN4_THETK|nr:30S ribosomal protein S4e [Thermoproteus tenax]CCC82710.1 30S ribosomal protein S4e [Thermoproteus tenax Kra 1]